jgi:benzoyl-CoA reductase/2-hydroxyglutaryl-CoA dehydratase subunit BcrC/BadD/HgdB
LRAYTGKDVIYLTNPQNPAGDNEISFYDGELSNFVIQLETTVEKKLDPASLAESIALYNQIKQALREIYRSQSSGSSTLKWSEISRIIQAGFLLDPRRHLSFLQETIADIAQDSDPNKTDKSPRLMLIGSPILPGDELLVKVIEDSGAKIVTDTLCTSLRSFEDLVVEEPTLRGIRNAYLLSNPCANMQCLDSRNDKRLNHIVRLIREYNVQGVIYYALRFCDSYAFKDDDTKAFLSEEVGVPMLAIHSDYGESDDGRLRTRIAGFIESLKFRRKARS